MDLIRILNELWKRRLLVVAAAAVALLIGISTAYKLPSFEKRAQLVGAATSQVLIDSSTSAIADVDRDPGPLANRAVVLAQYMSSAEARTAIAKQMGLSPTQIAADGPFSTLTDRSTYQATPAGPRANQLTEENAVYRLVFDAQLSLPIISIYTQAPDATGATELAAAATGVLTGYVDELDAGIPAARRITVSALGEPEGGTVNDGANPILAFLAFLGVFVVLCTLIVLGSGLVRQWREMGSADDDHRGETAPAAPEGPRAPEGMPQMPSDELLRPPRTSDRRGVPVAGAPRQHR
jgi:energy-converting hydrogenase Eha subunit F